jgi:phospholipase/carboxylesterase
MGRQELAGAVLMGALLLAATTWAQTVLTSVSPAQLASDLRELPTRRGPPPPTTSGVPHVQSDQNAPIEMQQALLDAITTLDGVRLWHGTPYSLDGSVGWVLTQGRDGPHNAYSPEGEFGHSHRPQDGSMHLRLPATTAERVIDQGWGVRHPLSAQLTGGDELMYLMVFGPRDEEELPVAWVIVQASYALARGVDLENRGSAIVPDSWGHTKAR